MAAGVTVDRRAWTEAAAGLTDRGWTRLRQAFDVETGARLAAAAHDRWYSLDDVAGIRQAGRNCGVFLADADPLVKGVARGICDSLAAALSAAARPLPSFNEVTWGTHHDGAHYITAHRDPPGAGGVIAILTLWGRARFRVWDEHGGAAWDTEDGDLVLLNGNGWPAADSRCPEHEVESPTSGDRMVLTYRYNRGGPGADYFA